MINKNRIVRVRNNEVHQVVNYVARLVGEPYQVVFDELLDYITEGHTIGDETARVLIERMLQNRLQ